MRFSTKLKQQRLPDHAQPHEDLFKQFQGASLWNNLYLIQEQKPKIIKQKNPIFTPTYKRKFNHPPHSPLVYDTKKEHKGACS